MVGDNDAIRLPDKHLSDGSSAAGTISDSCKWNSESYFIVNHALMNVLRGALFLMPHLLCNGNNSHLPFLEI